MTSAGHITIAGDGRPMVTMGAVDLSGTRTTMAQVVAEEFGLPIGDIHIHTGDTKSVGYSDGAAGSRVARTMTAALVEASRDALGQLSARAAEKLQCRPEDLDYARGVFRARQAGGPAISLAELMQATLTDGAVVGRGVSTKLPLGVEIGAHVCDVEVDTGTGQVTVLRYTAFQDVGLALNPAAVEGQIEGSVVQGLGWALTEGFDYGPDGRLRNASLLDYRMPTALDVPKIDCVIVETPVPNVPYGVRGVGEVPIVPPAACVANAIARAIGVRLSRMPMTPERVLRALQRRALTPTQVVAGVGLRATTAGAERDAPCRAAIACSASKRDRCSREWNSRSEAEIASPRGGRVRPQGADADGEEQPPEDQYADPGRNLSGGLRAIQCGCRIGPARVAAAFDPLTLSDHFAFGPGTQRRDTSFWSSKEASKIGAASVACTCSVPEPVLRKPCLRPAGTRIDWPFVRLACSSSSQNSAWPSSTVRISSTACRCVGAPLPGSHHCWNTHSCTEPVTADTCMRVVTPGRHSSLCLALVIDDLHWIRLQRSRVRPLASA